MAKSFMGDEELPSHEQALLDGEEVDVLALWRFLKSLLSDMIVEGCEVLALDKLRRLTKTQGESDLGLVHCAQMVF